MARTSIGVKLIAFLIFSVIARGGWHFLWVHSAESPAGAIFNERCPLKYEPPSTSSDKEFGYLSYTGVPKLDQTLCTLVVFFTESMKPAGFDTVVAVIGSLTPLILFTLIEAERTNRPLLIGFPLLLGIAYQLTGGGVIFPIYWMLHIVSGAIPTMGHVERKRALAILPAVVVGFAVPLYLMFTRKGPWITAIWNMFPILMSVVYWVAFQIVPKSRTWRSGTKIVQFMYGLSFIGTAVVHLALLTDCKSVEQVIQRLQDIWLPSLTSVQERDATQLGLHFLQWDGTFIYTSAAFFTLWFAESFNQLIILLLANIISTPLFGPSSAFALIMIWRERRVGGGRKQKSA